MQIEPQSIEENTSPVMARVAPTVDPSRAAHVNQWAARVATAREYWEKKAFAQMRRDMRMARGSQWQVADDHHNDDPGQRYVANILLRHIHQRTSTIYGKNPKVVAHRKKRMLSSIWDGNTQTAAQALGAMQQFASVGLPPPPHIAMLAMEVQRVAQETAVLDRVAKTLEMLFEHEIAEQPVPFKVQLKATIRRTLTTGVGWLKLGYQRTMRLPPEIEQRVVDINHQLATVERLSADLADGELQQDSAEADQLRATLQSLQQTEQVLVREGLALSFPESTSIIPDPEIRQLRGFVGANWVAEQYYLSGDRVKEVYGVDVGRGGGKTYIPDGKLGMCAKEDGPQEQSRFCVWEIYSKADGMLYVVCDGYPDFLVEPGAPDVTLERFFPWFPFVTNEVEDESSVFPPSDVTLLTPMQLELNRARQGLREHRRAARPLTISRAGTLEDVDKENLTQAKAHEVVELRGLPEGMRVEDALMPWSGPQVDPGLYSVSTAYEDMLRVIGTQEANLGGTSGATATETSIAEGSRMSANSSVVDDLDEFLSDFARAAGHVMLLEFAPETVKRVVGPGAVWPDLSREDVMQEIYLDVEAASTGRPNKAAEIQHAQMLFPMLLQIPGISPEWAAKELTRRLDDRIDLTDAFLAGLPSIQAMNGAGGMGASGAGPEAPDQQGPEGQNNAPSTEPPQANAAPRPGAGRPPLAGPQAQPGAPGGPSGI